jgi:hypothetical protein
VGDTSGSVAVSLFRELALEFLDEGNVSRRTLGHLRVLQGLLFVFVLLLQFGCSLDSCDHLLLQVCDGPPEPFSVGCLLLEDLRACPIRAPAAMKGGVNACTIALYFPASSVTSATCAAARDVASSSFPAYELACVSDHIVTVNIHMCDSVGSHTLFIFLK